FASKVAFEAYEVEEQDFAALAQHGFNEEDAWDIAAVASFFALSNRIANIAKMRPNDEFYAMGR
ncbi:MAG: alkylhydroperoxidase, partial [Alphaproteobacteria bacterium]|nr:alkylhydroperoxidase [Alphaproteobacteria bacterium]